MIPGPYICPVCNNIRVFVSFQMIAGAVGTGRGELGYPHGDIVYRATKSHKARYAL